MPSTEQAPTEEVKTAETALLLGVPGGACPGEKGAGRLCASCREGR